MNEDSFAVFRDWIAENQDKIQIVGRTLPKEDTIGFTHPDPRLVLIRCDVVLDVLTRHAGLSAEAASAEIGAWKERELVLRSEPQKSSWMGVWTEYFAFDSVFLLTTRH